MSECPVCFETTVLVRPEPCGHELCAQCLRRIGRRCALCRAHIDFAESVHERTRNVLWDVMLLPLQQPLLFADASAPTMPELEEALRTLCANRGIVMQHLRLQALARHPDTVRVSTQFQLSSLETNAVYFHFLARRALSLAEPSPELLRALREALALEWTETAQHLLRLLSRQAFRDGAAPSL